MIALIPADPPKFNTFAPPETWRYRDEYFDPSVGRIERACLWRRAVVTFFDAILMLILFAISFAVIFALGISDRRVQEYLLSNIDSLVFQIPLCTWLIYSTAMEASPLQATLGKMALGIAVCDKRGRRVEPRVVLARALLKHPCLLFHVVTGGAELPFVAYERSMPSPCLHDLLTRTRVVRINVPKGKGGMSELP